MTVVGITPRGFRQTAGRHQDVLGERGLDPRYPTVDRPLRAVELAELATGCPALIVGVDQVTPEVLATNGLRVVVRFGSGVDNVDLEAAKQYGVSVANTPGANAVSVAELTVALMFAVARRIVPHDRGVREGSWGRVPGVELTGRRLGIVGLGTIGREVARRADALGMEVAAFDPIATSSPVPLVDFDDLLANSDVVSIHCPLTETTSGLFSEAALRAMRHGSILLNTARGGIVDDRALAAALHDGHLGGAALDCFASERPQDSALWHLDNVVLTPHCGAATRQAIERAGITAIEEVVRALADEPLHHPVA